jgi:hypothetical protein
MALRAAPATDEGLPAALPQFGHIRRYWDPRHEVYAAKLLPGEYYVTTGDEMICTVLGSCVSACVRDRVRGRSTAHGAVVRGRTPPARRRATATSRWSAWSTTS